ncbi:MAG: M24 family metallopeptidase [Haloarculaceae archaeon]
MDTLARPDFDHELDRRARRDRARERMAGADLDALLLTGGPNLAYVSGASGMPSAGSSRPLLYLLPREGTPTLVVHEFLADGLGGGDAAVRTYDRLSSLPAPELREALENAGVADRRIGVEYGPETTLSVPAGEFRTFVDGSDAAFVDAQPLLADLRSRKSGAEIERVERACQITAEAFDRTFREVSTGTTGAEAGSCFRRHLLDCGGEAPWALVTCGPGEYDRTASGGSDRVVEDGAMVWIDGGCAVDSYFSDFSRAGVVGGPSERQREAQRAAHRITHEAVETIAPGVPMSRVASEAEAALDALDLPITARLSRLAGRVGHSLGRQVTELPSLDAGSEGTFRPGMVVTIEPAFATGYGTFHVEVNVVVTEEGTRTLSSSPWRLRTIAA